MESYKRSVELNPGNFKAYNNLGSVLHLQGDLDAAIGWYSKAADGDPRLLDPVRNLAIAWQAKGNLAEAEKYCRSACDMDPASKELKEQLAGIRFERGLAAEKEERLQEALDRYREAIDAQPYLAAAWLNRGSLLNISGQPEAAMEHHRKAIALQPDLALAHFNLGLLLLRFGDFPAGWPEYEWRWRLPEFAGQRLAGRQWDGAPLAGKTILLYAEQGFGDSIQFIRYAPLVAQQASKVLVRCQARLTQLLQTVPGVSAVTSDEADVPVFDVCCPLMSLPGLFGTRLETVPAPVPYLHADAEKARLWSDRLAPHRGARKIGLAWASHTRSEQMTKRKSTTLKSLAPLARAGNAVFFSLQKGPPAQEALDPPAGMRFVDIAADQNNFADSAAVIANLDLVISMDTAVAHLAGAMGKPVWIMVPSPPDWRWLASQADNPWYPSARLFRQERMYDWHGVISSIADALAAWR